MAALHNKMLPIEVSIIALVCPKLYFEIVVQQYYRSNLLLFFVLSE